MRRNLIYNFLKNLAVMSPQKSIGGLNAFAVYNGTGDFDKEAFGKSYNDFLKGYVWLRDWIAAGADKNNMKSEYPVLGVGNKTIRVTDLATEDSNYLICGQYQLILVAPLNCDTCSQEYETIQDIEAETFASLTGIIKSIVESNFYSYTDSEGNDMTGLFTDDMILNLTIPDDPIITDVVKLAEPIVESDFNFTALPEWGVHKLYGYTVNISVCLCEDIEFEFLYNTALWSKATTKCPTCP